MLHRTPMQAADAMYLPANWSQIDQEIIEALLFDQPVSGARYGRIISYDNYCQKCYFNIEVRST